MITWLNKSVSILLTIMGFFCWTPPPLAASQEAGAEGLKIIVLEGEDGVNIVKKKSAVKPVVEVRDKNNVPVAGAIVTFLLPNFGAGGTFAGGSNMLTLTTDAAGRAAATAMHPVGTGAFKISITASFHGQTATAAISQTNYLTAAAANAAGAGGSSGGATGGAAGGAAGAGAGGGLSTLAIVGIVAGVAAGVGAAVALKGGGGSTPSTPASVPHGTIGAGSGPVIGPPH